MTAGPRERAGFRLAPDDGICNWTVVRFQNKKVYSVFRKSNRKSSSQIQTYDSTFFLALQGENVFYISEALCSFFLHVLIALRIQKNYLIYLFWIFSAYPMHKTNEHCNSNGQRYSIACHAPAGVGDRENREKQNVREY